MNDKKTEPMHEYKYRIKTVRAIFVDGPPWIQLTEPAKIQYRKGSIPQRIIDSIPHSEDA